MAEKKLRTGDQLGAWKIGKHLGGGGQGQVWEVRPVQTNHSPPRAMKICTASEDAPRKRFEREVKLLGTCTHPNIPDVLDQDLTWSIEERTQVALSYYVTERFEASLDNLAWIHEAPLLMLRFFRDLCGAVEHLHSQSPPLLHRDIKPANVMYGGEPCRVALVDFGIGLSTENAVTSLTKPQEVMGTPRYRAPETLIGLAGDARVDVYGLGRTLEWLLTGQEPYELEPRGVPASSGLSSTARAQFDTVLRTACAFDPDNRFKSVAQLRAALPNLVADIAEYSTPNSVVAKEKELIQSTTDAAASYARARELLRARDVVAWRETSKRQHSEVTQALRDWRSPREAARAIAPDDLREWMDEALQVIGPALARACAAAEFPSAAIGDPVAVVRDLLGVPGWNRNGLTVLVYFPESVAYIAHNLVGATAVSVANTRVVMDLLRLPIVDRQGHQALLLESHELTAWPEGFGGKADEAWNYLFALSNKHTWLTDVFGSGNEYQTSIVAYWWLLSFVEFAGKLKAGKLDEYVSAEHPMLDIPVVWLRTEEDMLRRAFQLAFSSASAVAELCDQLNVNATSTRQAWNQWKQILDKQVSRYFPYRFRPVSFPQLPG